MPRTRGSSAAEFQRQIFELVRAGRDPGDLARDFEPTAQSIRWVARVGGKPGAREEKGSAPVDHDDLIRLRRRSAATLAGA